MSQSNAQAQVTDNTVTLDGESHELARTVRLAPTEDGRLAIILADGRAALVDLMTAEEVGDAIGKSRSRVHQIHREEPKPGLYPCLTKTSRGGKRVLILWDGDSILDRAANEPGFTAF